MEAKPIIQYFNFGHNERYLLDAKEGFLLHGKNYILNIIDYFLRQLEDFNLHVTKRAATDLVIFKKEMVELGPSHERLTKNEAERLNNIIRDIQKTLIAEAKGNVAYIVTDKRIDVFDVSKIRTGESIS